MAEQQCLHTYNFTNQMDGFSRVRGFPIASIPSSNMQVAVFILHFYFMLDYI